MEAAQPGAREEDWQAALHKLDGREGGVELLRMTCGLDVRAAFLYPLHEHDDMPSVLGWVAWPQQHVSRLKFGAAAQLCAHARVEVVAAGTIARNKAQTRTQTRTAQYVY